MAGASVPAVMEVLAAAGVTVVAMAAKVRLVAGEVEGSVGGGLELRRAGGLRARVGMMWLMEPEVVGRSGRCYLEAATAATAAAGCSGGEDVVARAGEGVEGRRGWRCAVTRTRHADGARGRTTNAKPAGFLATQTLDVGP